MATYYLKYRPQTIGELDLVEVRDQLTKVLSSSAPPHAFLFSGPRGLGKTSAARIVAKAINCEHKKKNDFEPCNQCDACISITKGNSVDVVEIDGASNRGIDDIRILREQVLSVPVRFRKKIFVIDEVHMLTKEAFNALLKTLEEPPGHVMFIFATTQPEKLPETIMSRTFQIQFKRASKDEVLHALKKVVKGESLKVEEAVLERIYERSKGGFRDSMKLMEQLALGGQDINLATFAAVFPQADVEQFINILILKDGKSAFEWIQKADDEGVSWEDTLRQFLEILEKVLLKIYGVGEESSLRLSKNEARQLMDLGLTASRVLKQSPIEKLAFEILVADFLESEGEHIDAEEEEEDEREDQALVKKHPLVERHTLRESEAVGERALVGEPTSVTLKAIRRERLVDLAKVSKEDILQDWSELLQIVGEQSFTVKTILRSSEIVGVEEGAVILKVFYDFHREQLETEKNMRIVAGSFEKVFAIKPQIRYILGAKEEKLVRDKQADDDLAKTAEEIFK